MTAESAQDSFEQLMAILGWDIAVGDKERKPFDKTCFSLGALADLSAIINVKVMVENKPRRIQENDQLARTILSQEP